MKNYTPQKLEGLISEIANEIAHDYPGIETCNSWEQLYAIKSCYTGTDAANRDLHELIEKLRVYAGLTKMQVVEFDKFLAEQSINETSTNC